VEEKGKVLRERSPYSGIGIPLGLLAFRLAIRAEKRNGLNWLDGEEDVN
jgi:hypothetical protein